MQQNPPVTSTRVLPFNLRHTTLNVSQVQNEVNSLLNNPPNKAHGSSADWISVICDFAGFLLPVWLWNNYDSGDNWSLTIPLTGSVTGRLLIYVILLTQPLLIRLCVIVLIWCGINQVTWRCDADWFVAVRTPVTKMMKSNADSQPYTTA